MQYCSMRRFEEDGLGTVANSVAVGEDRSLVRGFAGDAIDS